MRAAADRAEQARARHDPREVDDAVRAADALTARAAAMTPNPLVQPTTPVLKSGVVAAVFDVVQVVDTRYQAGRFGSGFKPRPKSDAGIRSVPLAPLVAEAIRRQLPVGSDPEALVFTGPSGGPGHPGGPGVPKGTRTVLSRHGFRRIHHAAVAKLADPATQLRPTAARVLKAFRAAGGPLTAGQLATYLAGHVRAVRPATVRRALAELHAAGLATADDDTQAGRWSALPPPHDPLLDALDLHGAHDFRHTFAVMGHEASGRARQQRGSAMGARTTGTPPRRWPPASPQRSSSAWRSCSRSPNRSSRTTRTGSRSGCSDGRCS
jgi:Fe2+ or Zn2+ uptake regulation protein